MHEQGYNVFVTFDGSQAPPVDLPESQYEAYELANYICYARYPVDQSTIPVFGDEQINILYSYYVDHLVPCLEANGYPIEYVPSKATFRATFESDQWAPYGAVDAARISDEDWQSLTSPAHSSRPATSSTRRTSNAWHRLAQRPPTTWLAMRMSFAADTAAIAVLVT